MTLFVPTHVLVTVAYRVGCHRDWIDGITAGECLSVQPADSVQGEGGAADEEITDSSLETEQPSTGTTSYIEEIHLQGEALYVTAVGG